MPIYQYLKANWQSELGAQATVGSKNSSDAAEDDTNSLPIVYGLATAYSASQIVLITSVFVVMAMLLGDGMAPSLLLMAVAVVCLLELHALYIAARNTGKIACYFYTALFIYYFYTALFIYMFVIHRVLLTQEILVKSNCYY